MIFFSVVVFRLLYVLIFFFFSFVWFIFCFYFIPKDVRIPFDVFLYLNKSILVHPMSIKRRYGVMSISMTVFIIHYIYVYIYIYSKAIIIWAWRGEFYVCDIFLYSWIQASVVLWCESKYIQLYIRFYNTVHIYNDNILDCFPFHSHTLSGLFCTSGHIMRKKIILKNMCKNPRLIQSVRTIAMHW